MNTTEQNKIRRWRCESPGDTLDVGGQLANRWSNPVTVGLIGPLGAGKTTFVKGLIGALGGAPEAVRSPTYTLLQEYEELDRTVVHVDLYRTSAASEQRTIGLEDYFGKGIVLVEWADRWELGWPERSVTLRFRHVDPSVREIELLDVAPDDISLDSSVNKSGEQVENYDTGP